MLYIQRDYQIWYVQWMDAQVGFEGGVEGWGRRKGRGGGTMTSNGQKVWHIFQNFPLAQQKKIVWP